MSTIINATFDGTVFRPNEPVELAPNTVVQLEIKAEAAISRDQTARQLENLKQLCEKLAAQPSAGKGDGLSNRDHDQILYGS